MKGFVKKFAVVVLGIMVFSMLVSAAYASTWLISYNVYTSGGTYNPVGKAQEKENATAVTSKINDTGFAQGYRVRVMGCDENGIDPVNRTVYNNYDVAYVFCSEDKYYVLIGLTQHGAQNAQPNGHVILSERSESKDLCTNLTVNVTIKAKILRLHSASLRSAQDDNALHYAK